MAGERWLRAPAPVGLWLAVALLAVGGCTSGNTTRAEERSASTTSVDTEPDADDSVRTSTSPAGDAGADGSTLAVTVETDSDSEKTDSAASDTSGTSGSSASSTSSSTSSITTTTSSTTLTPPEPGADGCRAGTTHCVGPGQADATLVQAVAAAGNGSVIELMPARYNETVAVAADNVTIRSHPDARATVDCSGMRPANGKACILAVGTNLTVEHLVVTGARGPDNNEACFRNEPGTRFVVRGVECHGSNNGILGSGGSWLIEDSHFHGNGAGDGLSHNLYLSGDCSEVVFRRSRSHGAVGGHAFKSRCRTSTVDSSELVDNSVADAAEFSNGGAATIRNSTISQPDGPNGNIIRHGAEGCTHGGTLSILGSTIDSARSPAYIRSECGPITVSGTSLTPGTEIVGPG